MTSFQLENRRFQIALNTLLCGIFCGLTCGFLSVGSVAARPAQVKVDSPKADSLLCVAAQPINDSGTKGTGSAG